MNENTKVDPRFFEYLYSKQLKSNLKFLKDNLPKKCTKRNYQLTTEMLGWDKRIVITQSRLEGCLQQTADMMRAHLQIKQPIKIILINNVDAGKFESIDGLNCIFINENLDSQNYQQKLAILAHEMTHYYLINQHGILKPTTEENELLTDLGAVYIGFGFLLQEGYKIFHNKSGNRIEQGKVGYINTKYVEDAIIHTAYLRKQDPNWLLENTRMPKKMNYYFRLFWLIRAYNKAKRKANKRTQEMEEGAPQ